MKIMKRCSLVVLMAVMLTFGACSVYHPQSVDIPLINHAGDHRLDVAVNAGSLIVPIPDVLTIGGTMSYGFNDWLAGQVHLNYGGDNLYGQLAPGYYLPLGEKSVLELYGGLGLGGSWRDKTDTKDNYNDEENTAKTKTYSYSGSFLLPFLQTNIGFHDLTAANIDLAFGLKAGAYSPNYTFNRYDSDGNMIGNETERYTEGSLLVEPQVQFRIGFGAVKYCLRLSYAYLPGLAETSNPFTYDPFSLSMGLNFTF